MAQLNITLNQEEILDIFSRNRDEAFKIIVQKNLKPEYNLRIDRFGVIIEGHCVKCGKKTIYRSNGSSVEIRYEQGKVSVKDSWKLGMYSMTADDFLSHIS